jgi:hypothetical protein
VPWALTRRPSGYFTVANAGRVLSVAGGSTVDGAWLEVRPPSPGSATQEWVIVQQTDGTYELANRKSGKLLEDLAWSTSPGAPMDQWSDADGRNQRWTLHQTAPSNLTTGDFTIRNQLAGTWRSRALPRLREPRPTSGGTRTSRGTGGTSRRRTAATGS